MGGYMTSAITFAAVCVGRHQSFLALSSTCLGTECQTPLFKRTLISPWVLLALTPTEKHTHAHTYPVPPGCQTWSAELVFFFFLFFFLLFLQGFFFWTAEKCLELLFKFVICVHAQKGQEETSTNEWIRRRMFKQKMGEISLRIPWHF